MKITFFFESQSLGFFLFGPGFLFLCGIVLDFYFCVVWSWIFIFCVVTSWFWTYIF